MASVQCRGGLFVFRRADLSIGLDHSICQAIPCSAGKLFTFQLQLRPSFPNRQRLPPSSRRAFHTSPRSPSAQRYAFGISSAFTAKGRPFNPNNNVFNYNPYNHILPRRKDKKTRPGSGQDAFFISRIGESSNVALGVADGVGGWEESGVDPADFSHGFCDYMAHAAYTHPAGSKIGPRDLMQRGYEDICKDKSVPAGGSTACVAIAKDNGELSIANLGDSGYIQLRLNAIHSASKPQTHAFNTPYQLAVIPEKMLKQAAAFGGQQLHDMPKDASVTRHELKHGDILILATDGVWDNLAAQEILKTASEVMLTFGAWEQHPTDGTIVGKGLRQLARIGQGKIDAEESQPPLQTFLAAELAAAAKSASLNTKRDGPFAREVHRYYPDEDWRGGKVDDICVVVVIVCEESK